MASTGRNKTADVEVLTAIEDRPSEFDLFGVLRTLEAMYPDRPRLGESQRVSEDCVMLRQEPSMAFAPSTLSEFKPGYRKAQSQLSIFSFGMFGPQGPMPLNLTEYAYDRIHQHKDSTFNAFADIFHHRAISLFYRSHAAAEPCIGMDRPQENPFDDYVGAMAGIYVSDQERGQRQLHHRLFYAGLFALETRPADALETLLTQAYGVTFSVQQFVPGWLNLRRRDQLSLGRPQHAVSLGVNTHLGEKVLDCQHRFSISAKFEQFQQFLALIPNGKGFSWLKKLVAEYVGLSFAWDLNLKLARDQVPQWQLGQSSDMYLGWSTWIGDVPDTVDYVDVNIDAEPLLEDH